MQKNGPLKVMILHSKDIRLVFYSQNYFCLVYKATGFLSLEGLKNMDSFAPSAGLFDLCLSVESPLFQGQYCSAFFKVESMEVIDNSSISTSKGVQEQDGDSKTYRFPRVGFCIPSSCNPTDFRSSVAQLITQNMVHHDSLGNQSKLAVTIITDGNYCYTKKKIDSDPKFDGPNIAVM